LRTAIIALSVTAFLALGSGQAFASHVSCGDTITQSATLDSDLLNCPGDGIVIGTGDITLDLNGHTIDGDHAGGPVCEPPFVEGNGVENPGGHDGITIENGTIQEFGNGIEGGYGRSLMRDLTVRSNRTDGIAIGSFPVEDSKDANEIVSNRVTGNGCGGIAFFGANDTRIELNTVTNDGFGGIIFDGCNNSQIVSNTVSGNAGQAIGGGGNDGNSITGNTVSDNGDGIVLLGGNDDIASSDNNVVANNSVTTGGAGVVIESSSHNEVRENSLHDNFFVGVVVVSGDDNRIEKNSVVRNSDGVEGGIHLTSNDQGDGSHRTVVSANTLGQNRGDGILVDPGQIGTVIDGNRSDRNSDDGIDVDHPATTLTKNSANKNGDLGIEAVAGVKDGGGNTARGNGNPAQCVNISCSGGRLRPPKLSL
jgi:parallel beta-helix repeat protein